MPPTRRKPSGSTARAQQTLAFGPNPNKVTKPSLPAAGNKKKKPSPPAPTDAERLQKAAADISTPSPGPEEEDYPPRPEAQLESPRALAIRGQGGAAAADVGVGKSEAEEKGGRVSDAQVRRYWKGKEDERIAPRVHQAGLSVNEKILRHFDLSSQYGVSCIHLSHLVTALLSEWGKMLTAFFGGHTALYRDPADETVEAGGDAGARAAGGGVGGAGEGGEEREWKGGAGVYGRAVDE